MEAGISISTEAFLLHCHVFSLHVNCAASQMNIYPLTTLLGIPPFAFRTTLILHAIYSKRCWKHSSEIFIHIDTIASQIHYMNLAVPHHCRTIATSWADDTRQDAFVLFMAKFGINNNSRPDNICPDFSQFPVSVIVSWHMWHLVRSSAAVDHLLQDSMHCPFRCFVHALVVKSGYLHYHWIVSLFFD